MIVFDCSRLYPFEYNGLQPHTSFLLIFSHILRVEGNTVVYLTVTFKIYKDNQNHCEFRFAVVLVLVIYNKFFKESLPVQKLIPKAVARMEFLL